MRMDAHMMWFLNYNNRLNPCSISSRIYPAIAPHVLNAVLILIAEERFIRRRMEQAAWVLQLWQIHLRR